MTVVRDRRGVAFIFVVLASGIALMLGVALLSLTSGERAIAQSHYRMAQALNLAEAGLADAQRRMAANPLYRTAFSGSLGAGTYSVTFQGIDRTTATVTSVGRSGNAVQTIVVTVRLTVPQALRNTLFSNTSLTLRKRTEIEGDLHVNGNLVIDGPVELEEGDSTVTGSVSDPKGQLRLDYDATLTAGAESVYFPRPPINYYEGLGPTLADGHTGHTHFETHSGDLRIETQGSQVRDFGDPYLLIVYGNLTIAGNYRGHATIVATGNITIDAHLRAEDPARDTLLLVSLNDILVGGTGPVHIDAVLYAYDQVVIGNSADMPYGSVLAETITLNQPATIEFNTDFALLPPPAVPGMTAEVVQWREQYPGGP